MKLNDSITSATRGMNQGKVRTALTMLGVVIGVSSVILIMSLGASAEAYIIAQIQSFGSNIIEINPGAPTGGPPASVLGIVIKTLKERDVESLRREPSIEEAGAAVTGQGRIVFESKNKTVPWFGVGAEYFRIVNFELAEGSYFSESDVQAYNHVIILGSTLTETLFGERNPLGKSVRLSDMSFRVVGVLESSGFGAFGFDDAAIIPITVGQKQILGTDYYQVIDVKVNDEYDVNFAKSRITTILRQNHRITDPSRDDFMVSSTDEALDLLGNVTSALTLFLAAIAAISLIVGGIGIMNIMLVSVTERTREIGLRKALGATEEDIQFQFLVESVILTSIGGSVGILIGAMFTVLAYYGVTYGAGIEWVFRLPPLAVILAVVVSVGSGVVFGVYPAKQAARKNPIDALRYE